MKSDLLQDIQALTIILSVIAGLFLLSLGRLFMLSRANRRVRLENAKMEKQVVLQHLEVTGIHHDAMSWRAKTQRQFDALRSDLSHRLQQSDQGGVHALKDLEEAHQKALSAALTRISELEAALAAKPADAAAASRPPPAPAPAAESKLPPPPSLPALPAMETLRLQSLESELAAAQTELALSKQQNALLQRDLLLARRRTPANPMRKSTPRSTARSV